MSKIDELIQQATTRVEVFNPGCDGHPEISASFDRYKFAELIVRECANAADMAYNARCRNPGDYVAEQLGYGAEHGVTAWRNQE